MANSGQFTNGHRKLGGRRLGVPNKTTADVKALARELVQDPEYRENLRRRLIAGQAGVMEAKLWDYAFGRPAARVELEGQEMARPDGTPQRWEIAAEEFRRRVETIAARRRQAEQDSQKA